MRRKSIMPALATRKSLWVACLLLAVAIISPVGFVVWLVSAAVGSERFMVEQLWREAESRALEDGRQAIIAGMSALLDEAYAAVGNEPAGLRLLLPVAIEKELADAAAIWAEVPPSGALILDTDKARSLLAEGRRLLDAMDDNAPDWDGLRALLDDPANARVGFGNGRHAGLMLARLILDEREIPTPLQERIRSLIFNYAEVEAPAAQRLNALEAWVERFPDDAAARQLAQAERLSWQWRQGAPNDPAEPIWRSGGIVGVVESERGFALLFSEERFAAWAQGRVKDAADVRFSLSVGLAAETRNEPPYRRLGLTGPLSFLELRLQEPAQQPSPGGRGFAFMAIGGIVFLLSSTSGFVIFLFLRRQSVATQLKNDLVATVTHELKTPVSSIRLLVDTLLDREREGHIDQREYLELIGRENQRLGHLIDNFLSFSRMERHKASFTLEPIDPAVIAQGAEQAFRERFQGQSFDLSVRIETNGCRIQGDRDALQSALGNLLENAFKYGCARKRILLRALKERDGVALEVEDFGRGVARRDRRRIFGRFYQADRDQHGSAGGVGLGLSIVAFIVAEHHGTVELRSEIGHGSVFKIKIPYAKDTHS